MEVFSPDIVHCLERKNIWHFWDWLHLHLQVPGWAYSVGTNRLTNQITHKPT